MWQERKTAVVTLADRVVTSLQAAAKSSGEPQTITAAALKLAYEDLAGRYDAVHGGIGPAPKFPKPLMLSYLLRYWKRTGEAKALEIVENTLQAIRRGGIYDHIGFGFHRYSTDAEWLVPHFEKMLYNQALLLMLYTEVYQATGKAIYADTAREIATYVLRDMTAPEGGFYSAEDADSEGEEGIFYFWTTAELERVLGVDDAALYAQVFQIVPEGNFREGMAKKHNIPHVKEDLGAIAARLNRPEADLKRQLGAMRQRLFAVREARVHPFKDDKILTDWNGLMIAALAKAGQGLPEPAYVEAAQRAADFVLDQLRDERGRLWKRYRNRQANLPGHATDYAYLVWGLLELYETAFEARHLQAAIDLQRVMNQYFWDDAAGGFFFTASDGETLITRSKSIHDMSVPSGNAVAGLNLLRLERMTANPEFADKAAALLQTFSATAAQYPSSHILLMAAYDFALGPSFEVVISGAVGRADTTEMLRLLRQPFLPHKVVVFRPDSTTVPAITRLAPFTQNQKPLRGKATAYVCQNYVCNQPTTDPQAMLSALGIGAAKAIP